MYNYMYFSNVKQNIKFYDLFFLIKNIKFQYIKFFEINLDLEDLKDMRF